MKFFIKNSEKTGTCYHEFYKGKWGCCYPKKNLVILNLYAICLPVELIDAIICHEYTHFKFQNHQKQFYQQLYKYCPRYDDLNKKLKEYQQSKRGLPPNTETLAKTKKDNKVA